MIKDSTHFASGLMARLLVGNKNVIMSPTSIMAALLRPTLGATGSTRTELLTTMGFDTWTDNEDLVKQIIAIEQDFVQNTKLKAVIATRMLLSNKLRVANNYLHLADEVDGVQIVDFVKDGHGIVGDVNGWVSKSTKGLIKDLLTDASINARTLALIVNAIYLKAPWLWKFDETLTQTDSFYKPGAKPSEAQMMQRSARYLYHETDIMKVLALPYADKQTYMFVFLPRTRQKVELRDAATHVAQNYTELLGELRMTKVHLCFPRFTFGWGTNSLIDPLKAMGIDTAFTHYANFSGISVDNNIFISDVLHKAHIIVNENGTEAAAATAVVMERKGGPEEDDVFFIANHPFVFTIGTLNNPQIHFVGQLCDPK